MDFILGLGIQGYDEGLSESLSFRVKDQSAYVALQYEAPQIREIHQGLGDANIWSLSVGYESPFTEKLSGFMEVGYAYVDDTIKPNIQTEVVYTRLVSHHHVSDTSVPTRGRPNIGETNGVHTEYELENGYTAKIGLMFRLNDDFSTSMSYRYLKPKEFWKLYDDDVVANCDCWWQETAVRDFSAFEFKVEYTF